MSALSYDLLDTEFGSLALIASAIGLREISFYRSHSEAVRDGWKAQPDMTHNPAALKPYSIALLDYLRGESRVFDVPLDLAVGTDLQKRVWQELLRIPFGATVSYSELAQRVGKPDAVRAVASACGKNPLPMIIPCHRVLAKDGSLGGFAWGVDKKAQLLALESEAA